MKRLITALVLLAVVIAGCVGTYCYIHDAADELRQSVSTVRTQVEAGDLRAAHQTMTESYTVWRQHYRIISSLVRHNEVDETERLYQRALQALENDDRAESLIQLVDLRDMLLHFPEMEQPRLSNIL